jgi:hypothetical protein
VSCDSKSKGECNSTQKYFKELLTADGKIIIGLEKICEKKGLMRAKKF